MKNLLQNSNIAIVGAGQLSKAFLKLLSGPDLRHLSIRVLGVADIDDTSEVMAFARDKGIFTTSDYDQLLRLEGVDTLIELTGIDSVLEAIHRDKPERVRLIDNFNAKLIFDLIQIEAERIKQIRELKNHIGDSLNIEQIFTEFSQRLGEIVAERTFEFKDIKTDLSAREMVLSQIIDGNTIPTFIINKNHTITHWNKAMEKLSGYSSKSVIGTRRQWEPFWENERPTMADVILDRIPEEKIKELYGRQSRKSTLIKDAYEAEVFFPKLGENGKWCYFTAAPIKAPDGKIIAAIETLWDTTDRRESRQKLKEYADNLEGMIKEATVEIERRSDFQDKLIRSSNDGILATDEKGTVVIYNRGAERIFGFPRAEVMGMLKIDQLCPESVANDVRAGLNQENHIDFSSWKEAVVVAKNGDSVPTRFSGSILFQEEEVIGSVCFFRDLREIKRLQNELVKSERLAAIGQTITGLSHYVKNILYGLKGGAYVLNKAMQKNDTDKVKRGWEMIERNISRISDLVMDLLTYSKEREPEPTNCLPNKMVEEVVALMTTTASENDIELEIVLDPLLKEVYLDPQVIHRALLNLISNAIDACLYDTVIKTPWRVKVSTALQKDNTIKFEVSDNGIGMTQETAAMLFSQLFSEKGQKGTGLGLLVTEKIVQENGGTIEVDSELGKGSIFTICLPFKEAKEKAVQG